MPDGTYSGVAIESMVKPVRFVIDVVKTTERRVLMMTSSCE